MAQNKAREAAEPGTTDRLRGRGLTRTKKVQVYFTPEQFEAAMGYANDLGVTRADAVHRLVIAGLSELGYFVLPLERQ